MVNYFFDKLPLEIIKYIYSLRLYYYIEKLYYAKIAQKTILIKLALNNNMRNLDIIEKNIIQSKNLSILSDYYIDPNNNKNYFILKKISKLLSYYDDIEWWNRTFIYPLQNGLILREYLFNNNYEDKLLIKNSKKYLFKLLKNIKLKV